MFFITYLRRELRRRIHQAIFVALGLALGVGLVVTVSSASAGVKTAEAGVLSALYGVGTDATVTGPPLPAPGPTTPRNGTSIQAGPGGTEICRNGRCQNAAGRSVQLVDPQYSPVRSADVTAVARLPEVSAAAGGLLLSDTTVTFPRSSGRAGGSALPSAGFFSVDGVDTGHRALGPLSAATITSGHSFTAADAGADVAVLDSGYAASNNLTASSAITIGGVPFTVIGIVAQPQAGTPPDVYIPLAAAQALEFADGPAETGEVNTIYVTAASAASIPALQQQIAKLLPHDTVTTAASLASQVTGSVAGVAELASDLGRWLAVLVLVAAFAVASLLTMAAVARRAAEFGTLKALGWRTRRIVAQVLGESVVMGIAGAAAGVGLGFAGTAIITRVAPKLPVTVPRSSAAFAQAAGQAAGPGGVVPTPNRATAPHVVAVPLHPSITFGVIVLAVILALVGGLLAGASGSWRIARLRPADTLAHVA
jgi:putative ABC transport system permease protein